MINAVVVADSINEFNDRLTTLQITFPRYILAELNTHRVLSKNSASSRAIPFKKMVESVQNNPFIPYAWQEDHKGMQGSVYLDDKPASALTEDRDGKTFFEFEKFREDIKARDILNGIWAESGQFENPNGTALAHMVQIASGLNKYGVTKQLANRLLEPFMWHTVLISGTEWENFFSLRCPQYWYEPEDKYFRSRNDFKAYFEECFGEPMREQDTLTWLKLNKGQADIHMMFLAEAIWDAMNESKPKQLKEGEWHIPYEDKIDELHKKRKNNVLTVELTDGSYIKVATGMAARASYTVVGEEKEVSYETLIGIHDKMAVANPFHASPFEHSARCMGKSDYDNYFKAENSKIELGWCRNFKGFVQYRAILEKGEQLG